MVKATHLTNKKKHRFSGRWQQSHKMFAFHFKKWKVYKELSQEPASQILWMQLVAEFAPFKTSL